MNTDKDAELERLNAITEKVIGCAYHVSNVLGCGFLEKPYENALAHAIRLAGCEVKQQEPINIWYEGVVVGEYFGDLLIEGLVLIELKAVKAFDEIHSAQCINYLKATKLPICLLINFGRPRVEIKRFMGNQCG
jgi:GxxExxY protein